MKDTALKVAGSIFFVVSIVHLLRIFLNFDIIIAGYALPTWFSILGFIFPLLLSLWMFKTSSDRR
jgi:hypothetical protein